MFKRTLSRLIIAALFESFSSIAPSVSAQSEAVDDYVKAEMEKQRIPGLALAVVRNGEMIKAKGYGFANVEHNVPVKPNTIFQSGSVGKQFTATAVMLLAEEGKIGLDDKITRYLNGAPEIWEEITVRHLLTHTSGLKNYTEDWYKQWLAPLCLEEI